MIKSFRWAAVLVVSVGGCAMFSKGHTHAEYSKTDKAMAMTVASRTGDYALYVDGDPVACVVHAVNKGQPLGFKRTDEGRVRAVAGLYYTTLPRTASTARWTPALAELNQ